MKVQGRTRCHGRGRDRGRMGRNGTGGGRQGKYAREGGLCCFVMNKDKRGNGQNGRDRCGL